MTLAPGARLGPYEIVGQIGAGGMGEVFRAKDPKLGRDVAIKVLPVAFAADPERLRRFQQEARTLAALSHPNVVQVYDTGEHEGRPYLVMELLEGETLRQRLEQGRLQWRKAVEFAAAIADGLAAAHAKGIIHRDLKPENLVLTEHGLKILDFGLAKQWPISPSVSSTVDTSPPGTMDGALLGTVGYMSPEQVQGIPVDTRSDIFALGCVLYEMVTGNRAFARSSTMETLAAILKDPVPELSASGSASRVDLDRILSHCLEKAPGDRFQNAKDLSFALKNLSSVDGSAPVSLPAIPQKNSWANWIWAVPVVVVLLMAGFVGWKYLGKSTPPHTTRFELVYPEEATEVGGIEISPDGLHIAFACADANNKLRIWIRPMNALVARPLGGTENLEYAFWAPDSQFIGFTAGGKLRKINIHGGDAQIICDAKDVGSASWGIGGVILFAGIESQQIMKVPANGGEPTIAVKADRSNNETAVGSPSFLPDGLHFLYQASGVKIEDAAFRVGCLDSSETKTLVPGRGTIIFAPPGFLIYARKKILYAHPFDVRSLQLSGDPIPIAENIQRSGYDPVGFSVSRNGTLAYQRDAPGHRLVLVDRSGKEEELIVDQGDPCNPSLDPTGESLAYDQFDDNNDDTKSIWIRNLKQKVSSRLTTGVNAIGPLWSPDGRSIVFVQGEGPSGAIYEKSLESRKEAKLLVKANPRKVPTSWTSDGKFLAFWSFDATKASTWILPMTGDRSPFPFPTKAHDEMWSVFSPDNGFVAYSSAESGRFEIYIQKFPDTGSVWQISTTGGYQPQWRSDGKELYFMTENGNVMAVDIRISDKIIAGKPYPLFQRHCDAFGVRNFIPTADGKHFIVREQRKRSADIPATVVLNWNAELGH